MCVCGALLVDAGSSLKCVSSITSVAISEGRLPLCNTSSEAGALPSEVRIENDSDRKFS